MGLSPGLSDPPSSQAIRAAPASRARDKIQIVRCSSSSTVGRPPARPRAMVIISTAVDDADPVAAANAARAPRPEPPVANNFGPPAAPSLFDWTTATAGDVLAGTTPWLSSPPPYYAGTGAYAFSSVPPPPPQRSHGSDLACYDGSLMDPSFPQPPAPPAAYTQPELSSYLYYSQEFPSSTFAGPADLEPTTMLPQLQVPATTQPATMPPPSLHCYRQPQATTTGSASVEEASPALADTQQDDTRPAPRRRGRGRPSKRATAVSEPPVAKPTKRVAAGSNRAASTSTSQKTSSAATGSTSGQRTSTKVLLCDEQCQLQLQRPDLSNGAPAGVAVEGDHQQAAIAPPELTATGPQYADTSAVGVRFHPTDQELIDYLKIKHAQQQMPVEFFKEFDVYQAHPMAIKGACGKSQDGCWYAFSRRDRRYKNGKRPARSVGVVFADGGKEQVGFWKSNSKLGEVRAGDGAVIGRMTSLTFQLGRQPRGTQTGWKMKEYTIPENQHQPDGSDMLLNDWVVCKLFYKERSRGTNTESNSEDDNAISVAVGQEDGRGEAAGESTQGEEDMLQMVPAAHQASDYSEQDLCVEDYLVCDVVFAQQNDAAN